MSNIRLLVKNYFRIFISRLAKLVSKRTKATTSVALLTIILGGIFVATFAFISYSTINVSLDAGIPELALFSFSTTLLMFAMLLIVTESSPSNKASDDEILLSLPFKKSEIVASKIIYFCLFDFIILAGLVLPSYIIYFIMVEGTTIFFLIRSILVLLLSTLFATGVSSIIATFFTRVTKRFRYSNVIQSMLSIVLLVAFLILYLGFTLMSQNPNYAGDVYSFYPIKLLTLAICDHNITSLLVLILICLGVFVLSVALKAIFYGKNITSYHSKKQTLEYNKTSTTNSLFKREIGKYFSIPIYVTNTAFGPLFTLLISLIITFVGKDFFLNMIEVVIASGYENFEAPVSIMNTINSYFNFGLIILITMTLAIAPTTASSISLENKELWILKAHPISYKDVFISKILVNIMIAGIPLLIASILLSINIGLIYLPFILLIPLIVIILTSIIGLYINLLYPKFGWETEQEVVKQGMAVGVTMLINTIFVIIPAALYFIVPLDNEFIKLTIIGLVYLIVLIGWSFILFKNGKKLYEKL